MWPLSIALSNGTAHGHWHCCYSLAPGGTWPLPVAGSSGTTASTSLAPGGGDHGVEAKEADREHDVEAHARGESVFYQLLIEVDVVIRNPSL